MLNRQPAMTAASKKMREWQTNAIATDYVYQILQHALDALEEAIANNFGLTGRLHVITYLGKPIAVCLTERRARRWLGIAMVARDDFDRSHYVITNTKIEE